MTTITYTQLYLEYTLSGNQCPTFNWNHKFVSKCSKQCDQKKSPNVYKSCPKLF